MSKATVWIEGMLLETFPELYVGDYACRTKNVAGGSTAPSLHSWPNALDITLEEYGYSTHPANQAYLDNVAKWLWDNREKLSLRALYWKGKSWFTGNTGIGHYNHIHIDFWPTGYATPPCMGGSLRYQYSNGRVVNGDPGPENGMTETNDPRPTPPPDAEGDYQMMNIELWAGYNSKDKGHQRNTVRACQILLAAHDFADQMSADKTCAADGWFGSGTDEQVRAFQRDGSLVVDGKVGRLTWAALESAT